MSSQEKVVVVHSHKGTVIVLALLLILTVAYFTGLLNPLIDWIKQKQVQESTGLKVTIFYNDGTNRTFDSQAQPLGMTIIDTETGKSVVSIRVELYITVVYTGVIKTDSAGRQVYTFTGIGRTQIIYQPVVVYDSGPLPLQDMFHPYLYSGKSAVISSSTLEAVKIENLLLERGYLIDGYTYTLKWRVESASITITFADEKTDTKSIPSLVELNWNFKYSSNYGIQSMSLSFQKVINP